MRCKRCGEPLEPMDTHCPVCGRAVAPRKKTVSQRNSETTIKLPQLEKFTNTYNQDAARIRTLQMATIAVVTLALALLVLVYLGVGDMRQDVASMQDDMVNLQLMADSQLQQNQSQETTAPTESTESVTEETAGDSTAVIPLSKRDLTAALELYRTSNGTYAAADLDLGTDDSDVKIWVNTSREGSSRWTNVTWILTDSEDRLDLKLHDSYGAADAQVCAKVSWGLSGTTFRSFAGADCVWEYRVPDSQWTAVSDECVTGDGDSYELRLTAEQLDDLLDQYTNVELRCRLSLTHPDGGMLEIIAGGISVNDQGLITSGDMLG